MTNNTASELKVHAPRTITIYALVVIVVVAVLFVVEQGVRAWDHRPVVTQSVITAADWGGIEGDKDWSGPDIYCISGAIQKRPGCGWPDNGMTPEKWVVFWQKTSLGKFPVPYSFNAPPTVRPGGWSSFRRWCMKLYEPRGTLSASVTHECQGKKVGPWEFLTHEIVAPQLTKNLQTITSINR